MCKCCVCWPCDPREDGTRRAKWSSFSWAGTSLLYACPKSDTRRVLASRRWKESRNSRRGKRKLGWGRGCRLRKKSEGPVRSRLLPSGLCRPRANSRHRSIKSQCQNFAFAANFERRSTMSCAIAKASRCSSTDIRIISILIWKFGSCARIGCSAAPRFSCRSTTW